MGTIRWTFLWSFSILCFCVSQAALAQNEPFKPGQTWTYRGATPVSSRVIIGAVDNLEGESQPIVSISVSDAPIPNDGKQLQTIPHLPVAADVLRESVVELEGVRPIPDGFDHGYSLWRQAYDIGKGGYFTVSVEEIVGLLRTQLGQRPAVQ
ncbi:hypothetical protein [Mesorhizobium loti]|uniref:hypothetical protein n=1 Tax=Rhizobium loti TaxID=381 RepID=UPI000D6B3439|nr:hypothetical protein [Mesorhizobium loti]